MESMTRSIREVVSLSSLGSGKSRGTGSFDREAHDSVVSENAFECPRQYDRTEEQASSYNVADTKTAFVQAGRLNQEKELQC